MPTLVLLNTILSLAMADSMRVLITNNTLRFRAGTELYVRDIALRLRELGHEPVCFAWEQGPVAEELRQGGIDVVGSLSRKHGPFDLIHGHHHMETMFAAMAFPTVPVLSLCHSPSRRVWQDTPSVLPNIVQYAAVDEACRDRLVEEGVPREKISLLLSFVDTRRFHVRAPLPPKPGRALVFSNYAHESTHVPAIRKACEKLGVSVDVAGLTSGHPVDRPEELLPQYDLVFAKARAAVEAMAVGCAVILCDFFGAGRMVTSGQLDELRSQNFGLQAMRQPISVEHLIEQILRYDPEDVSEVCVRIRRMAALDAFMPDLVALYERVASARVPEFDPWEAGAEFLKEEMGHAKDAHNRLPTAEKAIEELRASEQALRTSEQALCVKLAGLEENKAALKAKNDALKIKNAALKIKGRMTKEAVDSLRQKRRSWWKKLISP